MKTPRDILLDRHRAVSPKLDSMRQALFSVAAPRKTTPPGSLAGFRGLGFPILWRELVLPSRNLWAGLATVWAVILLTGFWQHDPVNSVTGRPVHPSEVTLSWQTRQQWLSERLADRSTPISEADRPQSGAPKPRTQRTGEIDLMG